MLSTVQNPPHRRGHAHRRSAAISGDFDAMGMDFFKAPNSTISQCLSQSLPQENTMKPTPPSLVITEPVGSKRDSSTSPIQQQSSKHEPSTSTPSPQKKHTRLNSWAHSFIKPKKNELSNTQEYNSSSSTEVTPENLNKPLQFTYGPPPQQQQKQQSYDIPEALIDLDRASGIFHDPSTKIPKKKSYHRRTESAPELEDFLKYKVFSNNQTTNTQNHQKNSAIFEEEEEEYIDEDVLSSASSNNNNILNKNPSLNSLNSNPGLRLNSPAPVETSTFSTPTSIKTNSTQQAQTQRRGGGATAARYQSYYNNSLALSNALKSSESLSQITNGSTSINQKPSISSFTNTKSIFSSASSINSSVMNSPSRFKFESKVYDIHPDDDEDLPQQQQQQQQHIQPPILASSPTSSSSSAASTSLKQVSSPSKQSKRLYIHKKSNSLLSSISLRMRRNSSTSQTKQQSDESEEDDIGDSTITPFNFGEPGPELDLTTMTPKLENSHINNNSNENINEQDFTSPKKSQNSHQHHHKKFFNWLKK